MIKKLLSVVMLISLICFSLSAAACSKTQSTENNDNNAENSLSSNTHPSRVDFDPSTGMYTTYLNEEYAERLYGASDEVLSSSTSELLEYFLQSFFMNQELMREAYLSSVPEEPYEPDYSCNEAFAELLIRDDLTEVLEKYAGKILRGKFDVNYTISGDETSFDKVLKQQSVKSLLTDLTDMPNLQKMYGGYTANS